MAKAMKEQINLAHDSVYEEIYPVQLEYNTSYNIPEHLTLKLVNREDQVLIEGLFIFRVYPPSITSTDSFSAQVNFYSDSKRGNLIYSTTAEISGFTFDYSLGDLSVLSLYVPVQFQDKPKLKITEDTVKYYVTILNFWPNTLPNYYFQLDKYCFIGSEKNNK